MEQLSGMDFSMLQMDTPHAPQHIAAVFLYDQTGLNSDPVRFKNILNLFAANLNAYPVLRCKLAGSTMGLDRPYWVADPNFDLEFHVRHIALPKPGDWRQLCIQLARLHSRGLDMGRSPWEAYVIEGLNQVEGLPENSFALMLKMHHAAVDGVALAALLNGIHTLSQDEALPELEPDDWEGEPDPTPWKVWSNAWINNLRRPVKFAKTLRNVVPKIFEAQKMSPKDGEKKGTLFTRFNAPVSSHRVIGSLVLDLNQVKAVKNSIEGITVNDVIVAVVGGGLRKYLQEKDELPVASLTTTVPISVRDSDDRSPRGNQVGMMQVTLATDIDDPVERMREIHISTRQSKEYTSATGARNILEISEGLWPPVLDLGFKAVSILVKNSDDRPTKESQKGPVIPNTIVSNVPGAQVPLYLAGARLHTALALGPIADGMGLFNGVVSTAEKITITFTSCREMMPDPQRYLECLELSWNELLENSPGKTSPRKRSGKRSTARKATT